MHYYQLLERFASIDVGQKISFLCKILGSCTLGRAKQKSYAGWARKNDLVNSQVQPSRPSPGETSALADPESERWRL
jgi:hypothetical protein